MVQPDLLAARVRSLIAFSLINPLMARPVVGPNLALGRPKSDLWMNEAFSGHSDAGAFTRY
jgi:hypothetical protein